MLPLLWVAGANRKVYVYNTSGGLLVASWTIDAANASPTGITLDPTNPARNCRS